MKSIALLILILIFSASFAVGSRSHSSHSRYSSSSRSYRVPSSRSYSQSSGSRSYRIPSSSSHSRNYPSHSRSNSSGERSPRVRSLNTRTYSSKAQRSRSFRAEGNAREAARKVHANSYPGARDKHGRIARSQAAKDGFQKSSPCPSTGRSSGGCPGYIIDHVRPLECGGLDAPSNMQWQTVSAAKAKDKTERACR